MTSSTRSGKVVCSIVQNVVFWIITRALQTQLITVTTSRLAQTRTVMRLTRYLTQQASYSSSHAAALRKEKHIHIDFVPSIPYVVPHFFGYPRMGQTGPTTYFLFCPTDKQQKPKGARGLDYEKNGTSWVVAATLISPTTIKIWRSKDDPWEDRSSSLYRPPLWRPFLMNTSIISPASSCKKSISPLQHTGICAS